MGGLFLGNTCKTGQVGKKFWANTHIANFKILDLPAVGNTNPNTHQISFRFLFEGAVSGARIIFQRVVAGYRQLYLLRLESPKSPEPPDLREEIIFADRRDRLEVLD